MTSAPDETTPDERGAAATANLTEQTLAGPAPRLADGVELVGRYEDSGFREAPYIARRADGQMIQMPPMLYALAEVVDGQSRENELARRFGERIERQVEPDMVVTLLEQQLRPLGVVAPADGSVAELEKADPLLALRFRTRVVPERVVRGLTTIFKPLFLPPVVVLVVIAFIALDAWLFGMHGVSQSLRRVIYEPTLLLMLVGGVLLATTFHEIGHATGTRYGGARPGVMGVGLYIVWPAFYTDITDAYRLGKAGRLRADLGGMYFNMVFALAVAAAYAVTGFEPILLLVVLQTFTIIQQSLPLLRLDGYYILSDLTGVPDMLTRIRPVLASLIPGHEPDRRVTELKPWVRAVVTGYVLTVVPLIGLLFAVMLIHAPRAFATGYDSFRTHYDVIGASFSDGGPATGLKNLLEMVVLVLPLVGLVYTTARVAQRAGAGTLGWASGHPVRQGGLALGTATAAAAVLFLWGPGGVYRPIQPGERGTLVSAVTGLGAVTSGRPALSAERQRELGGAPFRYRRARPAAAPPTGASDRPQTTPTTSTSATSPTTTTSGGVSPAVAPTDTTATAPATTPVPATTTPAPPATTQTTTGTSPTDPTTTTPPSTP